jgi:hypothetical protein
MRRKQDWSWIWAFGDVWRYLRKLMPWPIALIPAFYIWAFQIGMTAFIFVCALPFLPIFLIKEIVDQSRRS